MGRSSGAGVAAALLAVLLLPGSGGAATIIDDWKSVTVPPPPALASPTIDPRRTALLLLDFNGHEDAASGPCNTATKPRCRATLPAVRHLLDRARTAGMRVVYSTTSSGTPADIQPEIAPRAGEPVVSSGPDKFIGTDLGHILADRSIDTVIVTGTAAEGAVLDTATDAALHGLAVVVPVDGMSSSTPYAEQYVAWHVSHAPGVAQRTTLTRSDLIRF